MKSNEYTVADGHMVVARAGAKHAGETVSPREFPGGLTAIRELVECGALISPPAPRTGCGELECSPAAQAEPTR